MAAPLSLKDFENILEPQGSFSTPQKIPASLFKSLRLPKRLHPLPLDSAAENGLSRIPSLPGVIDDGNGSFESETALADVAENIPEPMRFSSNSVCF